MRFYDLQIESTLDGSNTLYVRELDEHYHSLNGAVQESNHVYINAGFKECEKPNINILEIGFGTGLNAYLTFLQAEKTHKNIYYTGLELYPLSLEMINRLNYTGNESYLHEEIFKNMHICEWGQDIRLSSTFLLNKMQTDLKKLDWSVGDGYDIIYFDAFAPDKQPDMWTQEIFNFLYKRTNIDGILTTYCAKGIVRRMLQSAGYRVERLTGPPGKREMLRGRKVK